MMNVIGAEAVLSYGQACYTHAQDAVIWLGRKVLALVQTIAPFIKTILKKAGHEAGAILALQLLPQNIRTYCYSIALGMELIIMSGGFTNKISAIFSPYFI